MNDAAHHHLLNRLAHAWHRADPVPEGMAERMRRHARAEVDLIATDWDHELMQLVDRSEQLAGTRSLAAAYLLRFSHGDLELLLRIAPGRDEARIDGWVVPALPLTVRVLGHDGVESGTAAEAGDSGRFELTTVPHGLVRLRLEPHDGDHTTIITPTFEI